MKKLLTCLTTLLLPALITGCGTFSKQSVIQGRDKRYLSASSTAALHVPPGLASNGIHNEYPIPKQHYEKSQMTISILPPGLGAS